MQATLDEAKKDVRIRMTVDIDLPLRRRVKSEAALRDMSVREYVSDVLAREVERIDEGRVSAEK